MPSVTYDEQTTLANMISQLNTVTPILLRLNDTDPSNLIFTYQNNSVTNNDVLVKVYKKYIIKQTNPVLYVPRDTSVEFQTIYSLVYTKIYLGNQVTVERGVVNLGTSKLQNLGTPVDGTDATHKNYVDTLVQAQKTRIDAILENAGISFDTFVEINTALEAEKSRAVAAENLIKSDVETLIKKLNALYIYLVGSDMNTQLDR